MSHAHGELAGRRHGCHLESMIDVMSKIRLRQSMREEQSHQISSQSDLKQRSLKHLISLTATNSVFSYDKHKKYLFIYFIFGC